MHQFGCGAGKHCALHSRQTAFGRIDSGCGGVENLTIAGRKDVARNKLNLPDYLPYLVNRVGAALVARFTADALEQHDLTIAMWRVLAALSDNGAQRQGALAGLASLGVRGGEQTAGL